MVTWILLDQQAGFKFCNAAFYALPNKAERAMLLEIMDYYKIKHFSCIIQAKRGTYI